MVSDTSAVYDFGPFRLEVSERRLLNDGRPVPLRTKVFDTLQFLVENAGRLLTKTELIQRVWPDTIVEENNLNHNVSVLRRALGEQTTGQRFIETVPRVGYRFVAEVTRFGPRAIAKEPAPAVAAIPTLRQTMRFCTATDDARIAYSTVGGGPPLVKAANWLNHLEYEWESPVWKHWIAEISKRHRFVRYDERGCGLSDWSVPEFSFEAWLTDLKTVVDALELERFPLLGISQGGAVAINFAARHPERVSHLILVNAYARGWQFRGSPDAIEAHLALIKLFRLGWGKNNLAFRQIFTTRFIPDAGPQEMEWFDDLQRISTSPENAARFMEEFARADVRPLLADLRVPTIVFHCQDDGVVPFNEGRQLAAGIPGATFVSLPSRNHLLLEPEPAWKILLQELGDFLGWPPSE